MQDSDLMNYEELSRIKVDGQDEKITNQDARKVYVAKESDEFKRTSDMMLGNDGKNLADGEYVNAEEFLKAAKEMFEKEEVKKIKIIKTGKKIKAKDLDKLVEEAKKAGTIILKENEKIKNQDARLVSVETPTMDKEARVAGMMLGKKGPEMANGEYVQKQEVEFEVVSKKRVPVVPLPPQPGKINISPTTVKLIKGLSTVAVSVGLVALLPYIMHANSVTWHHVGPEVQEFLHGVNSGLGKLINASYTELPGIWESMGSTALNADASTASLGVAIATYGVTAAGLTKVVNDIRKGVIAITNKIRKKDKDKEEKTNEEELGGKSI